MTALAADRDTPCKELGRLQRYSVAASAVIFKGAKVCLDAGGDLVPASDTAGLSRVIGVSEEYVDNSSGADGDATCLVRKGVFGFVNDGNVTQAQVGGNVTVLDDQTVSVAATTVNDVVAGTLETIDADDSLCYVKIHEHA